jgi:hypothetical protein
MKKEKGILNVKKHKETKSSAFLSVGSCAARQVIPHEASPDHFCYFLTVLPASLPVPA